MCKLFHRQTLTKRRHGVSCYSISCNFSVIRWYSTGVIIYNDNSVTIDEAMTINWNVPGDDESIITTTHCHQVDNAGAVCEWRI